MLDRFKDAKWYIGGGDELNTIIYDASDLEGTGPDGHGMVCESATPDDARLIASSPNLLAVAKLAQSLLSEEYGDSYEVLKQLDAAIAKAEGN